MSDAPSSDRRPREGGDPAAFDSAKVDSRVRGNDGICSIDAESILARLAERRSCRAFDGNSMPREVVEAIMQDGLEAPSSCNQQQWHFVVVDAPEEKRRAQAIAGGNPHFLDAAAIVYLCF